MILPEGEQMARLALDVAGLFLRRKRFVKNVLHFVLKHLRYSLKANVMLAVSSQSSLKCPI